MTAPAPTQKVAEVVQTTIYTLTPDTGVASAARLACADGIKYLLVLDNGTLAGLVSDGDLFRARGRQPVREVMRSPVLCISPEQTCGEALLIMEQNRVSYLPVVTSQFVVGYVDEAQLRGVPAGPGNVAFDPPPAN